MLGPDNRKMVPPVARSKLLPMRQAGPLALHTENQKTLRPSWCKLLRRRQPSRSPYTRKFKKTLRRSRPSRETLFSSPRVHRGEFWSNVRHPFPPHPGLYDRDPFRIGGMLAFVSVRSNLHTGFVSSAFHHGCLP